MSDSSVVAPSQSPSGHEHAELALKVANALPGWLRRPAAILTLDLALSMPPGPGMEIGVHFGKMLSVIRSGLGKDQTIVGYDLTLDRKKDRLLEGLNKHFDDLNRLKLFHVDSVSLTPDRVLEDCGGRPVVISVDGSHKRDPVLSDLRLAEAVLNDVGFVAFDDFLNAGDIGANEAFYRYTFADEPGERLVPFALVTGKLFLCRPAVHHQFLTMAQMVSEMNREDLDPAFKVYKKRTNQGLSHLMQLVDRTIISIWG